MPDPIYVTRSFVPPREEFDKLLNEIWTSGQFTNGGKLCQRLEDRLGQRFDLPLRLVGNGTLALQLALRSLGVTGSVVTTPYSYVATTNALLWEGIQPRFADVEPEHLTLDPARAEAAIGPDTTAILATHVYGYPCRVEELTELAQRRGLHLIYDAAHAFDVRFRGRSLLEYGDAATLSFHATKVFHTFEGGGIACRDEELAQDIHLLRTFGHAGREYYQMGINAKMSEVHAAAGLVNLSYIDRLIDARRRLSERYCTGLEGLPLRYLHPESVPDLEYNYAYFPVFFATEQEREKVISLLEAHEIYPRRYFEPSLNELPFLTVEMRVPCPVSERAARTVLCLPLYAELAETQVDQICATVRQAYEA